MFRFIGLLERRLQAFSPEQRAGAGEGPRWIFINTSPNPT